MSKPTKEPRKQLTIGDKVERKGRADISRGGRPKIMVPPARLRAEVAEKGIELMNAYTMTATEWTEAAWLALIEKIERGEKAIKRAEAKT